MDYREIVLSSMKETAEKILKRKVTEIKSVGEETSPISVEDFTIIVGMAGQVGGQLIFGFKDDVIWNIAERMLEQSVTEMDELTISTIAEFTNVLSGNATIMLVDEGSKKLGISPPSIIMGKNMRVSTKIKPIQKFRMQLEGLGEMVLHIALREKEE